MVAHFVRCGDLILLGLVLNVPLLFSLVNLVVLDITVIEIAVV